MSSPLPLVSSRTARARWLLSWTGRVAEFAFVQCWVQLFTAIAGLIVVRTLSKEDYGFYAIANTMQPTADMLAELGIGMGVRTIGGRIWHDRARFGQLVTTALELRRSFACLSIGACLPVAVWMLRNNGATWPTTILLCTVIMAGVVPQLGSSVLLVVLSLHGEYRKIQKLNIGNAVLRLAAIGALALSHMNAWLATGVAAAINWRTLVYLRRWAPAHADFAESTNADDRRELSRLSARMLPNTLFCCFQGQIALLILTFFGNPSGIADVTALGRLAVLLTAFAAAFNNVLVPRFARCQDTQRLPRLYLVLIVATVLTLAPVVFAGWFMPSPLLMLLGGKYAGLQNECGWVVSTVCVTQLVMVLQQLNTARSWIRFGTTVQIPLTIATQILALTQIDVSSLHGVVLFGFLCSFAPLPGLIADAYLGLRKPAHASPG